MAKIETPKRTYMVLRNYKTELESVLRVPAPNIINGTDLTNIIRDWLKQEKVNWKHIHVTHDDIKVDAPGYDVKTEEFRQSVMQLKLYKYTTTYKVEEEEELPF